MNLKPRFATNLLSVRIILLVTLCALIVFAVVSEPDIMRAQQSSGPRATVRHGFTVNGRIEGSLQQLTGEATTLNGGGVLTGDLLVPGTPTVRLNGNPTFGGTVPGSGNAQPANYQITLNGNSQLGRLVTRTDPIVMPTVPAPPTATGTRDVTLNNSSQSPGNFATLRDLTLNGNVGNITVPPGTYRKFTANGGSGFVLGVSGAAQPAVYNFNSLLLNGGSQLQIVGPVVLTSATAVTINAPMGSATNPFWLNLNVAAGGLTLNGGSALYGVVTAPSGLVTINGNTSLIGNVICDRLTTNGNGLLRVLQQQTDTTPPVLTVTQPANGSITTATQSNVTGTFSDQSATTITVNGAAAAIQGNSFTASVSLAEGLNTIQVLATDAAGNQSTASRNVTRDSMAPVLNVITPAQGLVTTDAGISVFGEVTDATQIALTVDGVPLIVNGSVFSAQISPPEGTSQVHVRATDAAGNFTEVVRTVTSDFTEPVITDLTPLDGTLIVGVTTTIQGRVIDATAVTVKVGNTMASVAPGGLFTAANVPLAEGENELLITATDVAGNKSEAELLIVGKDLTNPAAPIVFPVRSPTKLSFQSIEGRAEPGSKVRIAGGVTIAETSAAAGTGLFVVNVDLSVGANALQVTSTDATNNVSPAAGVSITSNPDLELAPDGQPSRITVATGDTQRGLINVELPRPLIAIVRDRSGNTVANTTVRFSVTHGGGLFTNGSAVTDVQTDAHGYASARYVSGVAQGIQLIRADFAGNVFAPTTFMAEALIAAPGGSTSVSGTVRDVNLRALPNVLVRISGQQTHTGVDGRFRIENVPAGPHQILELIGRDQITLPGRWPNISYDIDVLPGVDNNPGRQLFLPKVNDGIPIPLDSNNVVTQDTSAQLYVAGGEPPIVVTARAGTQVTFPPDVTDKRLSVTRIPVSRVPMPLEDGLATNLFISVQPSGAIFDQPLEVSFPNFDQLPPGTEVLLMSFDHDAGRYLQVGSGRVSADGQRVTSDPGSGIRVGAWHAFPPSPPSPGGGAPPTEEITVLGTIKITGNRDLEGIHIDDVLAQLGGRRAMVLTAQAQWHHSPELLVRGTETRRRGSGGSAAQVHIDVDVQKTLPEVTLEEVEFKDNYTLRPDDGGQEYKDPHWLKPATPDPTYKGKPVAYKNEGQKKIKLAAKFSLKQEITEPPKPKVMVKANGNDAFDLDAVVAKYDKGSKTVKLEGGIVSTAFPTDTIDYIEAMNFEWEVSLDGGTQWNPGGTSSNPMYVTLGKPGQAFLTTVHLATVNLRGKTKSQMQVIVDTIWADFSDRAVYRASDTNQQTKLKYWGTVCNVSGSDPDLCFEPKGLMVQADARCEGWSEFFFDVLKTQGVSVVKIWIQGKPKSNAAGQFYVSGIEVVNNPSQGDHTLAPPTRFNGHAIVRVKVNNVEKLYDPSYGTGPFANLIAWEDASLIQVIYRDRVGSPTIPSLTETNKPNSEETVLVVQ